MILGIDLGTSNSMAAAYIDGKPVIIKSRTGNTKIPSVIYADENNVLYVGDVAREKRLAKDKNTVAAFKRTVGKEDIYKLRDKEYNSEELSTIMLRSIVEDASMYLNEEVKDVVISVPAFFNNRQKKSVMRAGEQAGLNVKKLIHEPTAAAMTYGVNLEQEEEKVILVLDLGGGTFDISVMEVNGNVMEVVSVCGDNNLGGEDFTKRIIDMFIKENGITEDEAQKEYEALYYMAEHAKYDITRDKKANMKCTIGSREYEMTLYEGDYEESVMDLLERIRKLTLRAIEESKYNPYEISDIIMVGGGTRLSIIKNLVEKMLGKEYEYQINPDEAVALGAALQGALIEKNATVKDIVMTDICPYYIGTFSGTESEFDFRDNFSIVISKNSVIPKKVVRISEIATGNREYVLYQAEDSLGRNKTLMAWIAYSVPYSKTGRSKITISHIYDINGILEVEILVHENNRTFKSVYVDENSEVSREEAEKRIEELKNVLLSPYENEENTFALTKAERLYEELLGNDREYVGNEIEKFEAALNTQNDDIVNKARERILEVIERYDSWN